MIEMTETKGIKKCRRRRVYRPFDSREPRQRNACPRCNSVSISMRSTTRDYVIDVDGQVRLL